MSWDPEGGLLRALGSAPPITWAVRGVQLRPPASLPSRGRDRFCCLGLGGAQGLPPGGQDLLVLLGLAAAGGGGALLLQAPLRPDLGAVGSGSVLGLGGGRSRLAGLLEHHLLPLRSDNGHGQGAAGRGRLLVELLVQGRGEREGGAVGGRADECHVPPGEEELLRLKDSGVVLVVPVEGGRLLLLLLLLGPGSRRCRSRLAVYAPGGLLRS